MKVSCWKTFQLTPVSLCLQVCVSWLWWELGSERDWSVPLHAPAKHPGRPFGQPRQPVFLHRPSDQQELHHGWSIGHQLLSKRSVCICFVERIMLRHPRTFFCCVVILLSSLAFWIVFVFRLNRPTYLHLSAPLPSRQSVPARGRAGPQSQRGAPCHLPGCGTCKRFQTFVSVICEFLKQQLWCSCFFLFCWIFPPDNRVHLEVCQENSSEHDVWTIEGHHVSCASPF